LDSRLRVRCLLFEQAEEAIRPGRAGASRRSARDQAQPGCAHRATARGTFPRVAPAGDAQVVAVLELLHLPHVGQQLALGLRETLQHPGTPAKAEQWLDDAEIEDGTRRLRDGGTAVIPHEGIGEPGEQFAARRGQPADAAVRQDGHILQGVGRVGAHQARVIVGAATAERQLGRKLKPFERHVQRAEIQVFALGLIIAGIVDAEADGALQIKDYLARRVGRQELTPGIRLHRFGQAVRSPRARGAFAIHPLHQLVRDGIIRGQGRVVGVERIEEARFRVESMDAVSATLPVSAAAAFSSINAYASRSARSR